LLGPPEARADYGTLGVQLMGPAYKGDSPYYISRLKFSGDGSPLPQGFACDTFAYLDGRQWGGTDGTVYNWTSTIGGLEGFTRTGWGAVARFHNTGITQGTISVTMTDSNYPGQAPNATFPPVPGAVIQVFDADLVSPAAGVDDSNELVKPTFIGPGCDKEFQIQIQPAVSSLPDPTSHAWDARYPSPYDDKRPH
jgi:hypothetical protein